jgi:hypothetical protein
MTYRKCKLIVFGLSILLGCNIHSRPAHAQSPSRPPYDPGRVPWSDLTFAAKNFWVEVTTRVQLIQLPAAEAEALLLQSPRGVPVRAAAPHVSQITIDTTIDPKFRPPVTLYSRMWFNPADASALGRITIRRGEDDYKRIYRFTGQGVFRHQLEPKDKQEALLTPENWTHENNNFYAFDPEKLDCFGVAEPSVLIYIPSAADISVLSNPLSMCVFGKRRLHRVRLQKQGTDPINVNFIQATQQRKVRREERIDSIKIAVSAEPMESDPNEDEIFSFLGLQKDIAIYIDPATYFPMQVSGIIPTIGNVDLKLNEVQTDFHPN